PLPTRVFDATSTTAFYTLSLHDALPIYGERSQHSVLQFDRRRRLPPTGILVTRYAQGDVFSYPFTGGRRDLPVQLLFRCPQLRADRKSTRLNSSHVSISYAVFCLKKNKT